MRPTRSSGRESPGFTRLARVLDVFPPVFPEIIEAAYLLLPGDRPVPNWTSPESEGVVVNRESNRSIQSIRCVRQLTVRKLLVPPTILLCVL